MPAMDNAYALIIGIADYRHITKLPATVRNDAQDVRGLLVDPQHGGYAPDNVKLLLDGEATREGILGALSDLAARTDPTSGLLIYISGHGGRVVSGARAGEYLLPVDTVLLSDEDLALTAIISGAEFTGALKAIPTAGAGRLRLPPLRGHRSAQRRNGLTSQGLLPDSHYERLAAGRGTAILSLARQRVLPMCCRLQQPSFTQHLLAGLRGYL